jgi:luciferase family oxidoreductase group 1
MTPLSVLDLTPVPAGATAGQAIRNTVELARHADRLGYTRYWLAEHHNTPGMACPAPPVMIGRVADATERIRVGSGGVMLPNHSALHTAETFRVLEALHPGRIDLGIGRAPGTDPTTAFALRRGAQDASDFPGQLAELFAFADGDFPDDHPYRSVHAEPTEVPLPPVWILGSSDYGARVAAAFGLGFAFARHLNPRGAAGAVRRYRDEFRPSAGRSEPYAILAVSAICADRSERAHELAMSLGLGVVRMRQGRPGKLPTPEEAAAHAWTEHESDQLRRYRRAQVLGTPSEVREQLDELVGETAADEVMIMTSVHDHGERLRSYELIAGAFGLGRGTAVAA